jgi:hypothetical protein
MARGPRLIARWVRAAAGVVVLVVLPACTGSSAPAPATPRAGVDAKAVVLTCEDAGTGTPGTSPSDVASGGAVLEQWAAPTADVPVAAEVGLVVPPRIAGWHFRKTPVYLRAGEREVTATVPANSGAALAWVPADVWTTGGPPHLDAWLATSVTFQGCPDRITTYFGGIAAATPATCVDLALAGAGSRRRLDGGACA